MKQIQTGGVSAKLLKCEIGTPIVGRGDVVMVMRQPNAPASSDIEGLCRVMLVDDADNEQPMLVARLSDRLGQQIVNRAVAAIGALTEHRRWNDWLIAATEAEQQFPEHYYKNSSYFWPELDMYDVYVLRPAKEVEP